jgi:predicted hotdog family 3-hydroxylacyl-ACP dehydratase
LNLDQAWIAAHIPHQGAMCLLDAVLSWDEHSINCRATSHRRSDHPLRAHGRLGAACAIEYAAQAMAVHGALVAASAPLASSMTHEVRESIDTRAVGYLASVRNVTLHVVRLDDLDGELVASAERVTGNARSVLYEFELWSAERPLLSGRASIVIETAASAVLPGGAQP